MFQIKVVEKIKTQIYVLSEVFVIFILYDAEGGKLIQDFCSLFFLLPVPPVLVVHTSEMKCGLLFTGQ